LPFIVGSCVGERVAHSEALEVDRRFKSVLGMCKPRDENKVTKKSVEYP
jgi:hypothetical protein